jgi:nucleotide-binding universal stress UspA family protein
MTSSTRSAAREPLQQATAAGSAPPREAPAAGVVVGYDGSASSGAALDWATAEARRRGAPLTVLCAADWFTGTAGLAGVAVPLDVDWEDMARSTLDRARARVGAPAGVEVRSAPRRGSPARALVTASETADLVVVGHRGRGALVSAVLGSVAFSVTAHAHCPVVVVRGDAQRPPGPGAPVVVGVDGSAGAAKAVGFAAATAAGSGAPLLVVAAWTVPDVAGVEFTVRDFEERMVAATRQLAQDVARDAVAQARRSQPGLDVQARVVEQPAAEALDQVSGDAGLVVVGARGRGGLTGLFLGSVSRATIHGAACPVAVVRQPHP